MLPVILLGQAFQLHLQRQPMAQVGRSETELILCWRLPMNLVWQLPPCSLQIVNLENIMSARLQMAFQEVWSLSSLTPDGLFQRLVPMQMIAEPHQPLAPQSMELYRE